MRHLFLDLETIRTQHPAAKAAIMGRESFRQVTDIGPIEAAKNLKDPLKIQESISERTAAAWTALRESNDAKYAAADKAWGDTALDGWFGHIAFIGFAIDDKPVTDVPCIEVKYDRVRTEAGYGPMVVTGCNIDVSVEKTHIEHFFKMVGDVPCLVVGHRVRKFDILFLWQRCICLGIPVPWWLEYTKDSTRFDKDAINDTSEMCGTTLSNKPFGPSLNSVCEALGIPVKGDITGAGVWDAINDGRFLDVGEYCRWDVRRVRSVWRRLKGLPALGIDMPKPDEVAA